MRPSQASRTVVACGDQFEWLGGARVLQSQARGADGHGDVAVGRRAALGVFVVQHGGLEIARELPLRRRG